MVIAFSYFLLFSFYYVMRGRSAEKAQRKGRTVAAYHLSHAKRAIKRYGKQALPAV